MFFLSFAERVFIQTRRLQRVCNQPIESVGGVSRVTKMLQLNKKQAFLSATECYKRFAHAFSCAYTELWTHLASFWWVLKRLELLSAAPQASLTHLSCSPNFPRASISRYAPAKHEHILYFRLQTTTSSTSNANV